MAREPHRLPRALPWLLLGGAAAGVSLWFNRDPDRTPPDGPGLILAPADGRVLAVEAADPPFWFPGPAWRIAIFLGPWDVHVQRAPVKGRVVFSQTQSGGHRPAFARQAAHNHGHWLGVNAEWGNVLLLRSAGVVARRVTTRVTVGQEVDAGERIGRILLGSRAELYLPAAGRPLVREGDHVCAGESVVARWPGD
jgi:phosphatidylserine decarboxylase